MRHAPPFQIGDLAVLSETLVVDFLLAAVFFTALAYSTLRKRLEKQRAAAAVSTVTGIALATGLVWWESQHGLSIRNLGPIALFLAVVFLALAIFAAIRRAAGSVAAIGAALVLGVLFAGMLGMHEPLSVKAATPILIIIILVSLLALVFRHNHPSPLPTYHTQSTRNQVPASRQTIRETRQFRKLSERLWHNFRDIRHRTPQLEEHPEARNDLMLQLRRMLPEEGWLTDRMAALRERAHLMRAGHISRMKDLKQAVKSLPPSARRKAADKLVAKYHELVGIDKRLERLDQAVASTERQIRELTREAQVVVAQYEFKRYDEVLKKAEKLQNHNTHLCRLIGRTEEQLIQATQQAVKNSAEVADA